MRASSDAAPHHWTAARLGPWLAVALMALPVGVLGLPGVGIPPSPGRITLLGDASASPRPLGIVPSAGGLGGAGPWFNAGSGLATFPPDRQAMGIAYDPLLNATVVFGGQDTNGNALGDTWEYVNGSWTSWSGSGPSARWGHVLVYDPKEKGIVMFGGHSCAGGCFHNDTWLFNASGWTNISKGAAPPLNAGGQAAYDGLDGYLLLPTSLSHGGSWKFAGGSWTNITGSVGGSLLPNLGSFHGVYDAGDHYLVYYGGASGCTGYGLTYSYAGGTWKNITGSSGTGPNATMGSGAFTYDEGLGAAVLFGGYDTGCNVLNETWAFYHGNWSRIHLSGPTPPGVWDGGFAYDRAVGGDVLFGGNGAATGGSNQFVQDTWTFGTRIVNYTATAKPSSGARPLSVTFNATGFFPNNPPWNVNWSFGDGSPNASGPNATHTYLKVGVYLVIVRVRDALGRTGNRTIVVTVDPGSWQQIPTATVPAPPGRQALTMEYDPLLGATVLFGGNDNGGALGDTWEFVNETWIDETTNFTVAPSARWAAGMVFDPQEGGLVLYGGHSCYGGCYLGDTWLLNLTGWHLLSPNGAPPAAGIAGNMFYDSQDGYILIQANGTYWTFANNTWTNVTASITGAPPPGQGFYAAYDAADGYAVLYGGNSGCFSSRGATYTYSGGKFTNVSKTAGAAPAAVDGSAAMTYDPIARGVLFFGGYDASCHARNQTWLFSRGHWSQLTDYSHPVPPGRWDGRVAFDASSGGDVMTSGNENAAGGTNSFNNDTWLYADALRISASASPARCDAPCSSQLTANVLAGGSARYTYFWNFSDGSPNASGRTATHLFSTPGTWVATVTANDSNGTFGSNVAIVQVYPRPNAHPYTSVQVGETPLTVQFMSNATGGVPSLQYAWQFGDGGSSSTLLNATHVYLRGGTFEWNLSVTDALGTTIVRHGNITVYPSFVVHALDSRNGGAVPLTVFFNASAIGGESPYTYSWAFGDGTTGPNANTTSHTYTQVGRFTAWANVSDQLRIVRSTRFTIDVVPALVPGATESPATGEVALNVSFGVAPTGGMAPYRFLWKFGVGNANSTLPSPSFVYSTVGTFHPQVAVTDAFGDIAVKVLNVTTVAVLTPSLTARPLLGIAPLHVSFAATATGGVVPIGYTFRFGDGQSATGSSANHTYIVAGRYNVTLVATDAVGDLALRSVGVEVAVAPQVALSVNLSSISLGASVAFSARAADGFAPYTFTYGGLPAGCSAGNVSAFDCTPTAAGDYNLTVTVTDSDHNAANASVALVVLPTSSPTHPTGAGGTGGLSLLTLGIVGAVAAAAAIGVAVVLLRRRGGAPPPALPSQTYAELPPPEAPALEGPPLPPE